MKVFPEINCEVSVSQELRVLLGRGSGATSVDPKVFGEELYSAVVPNIEPPSQPKTKHYCFRRDGERPLRTRGTKVIGVSGEIQQGSMSYCHSAIVVLDEDQSVVLAFSLETGAQFFNRPIYDCTKLSVSESSTFLENWVAKLADFFSRVSPTEPIAANRAFHRATHNIFRKKDEILERKSQCLQ